MVSVSSAMVVCKTASAERRQDFPVYTHIVAGRNVRELSLQHIQGSPQPQIGKKNGQSENKYLKLLPLQ